MTTTRRAIGARLLSDEVELEHRPIGEVEADLGALRLDPGRAIAAAQRAAGVLPREQSEGIADRAPYAAEAVANERRWRGAWLTPSGIVGTLRIADVATVLLAGGLAWITRFHDYYPNPDLALEGYAAVLAMLLTLHVFERADLYNVDRLANLFGQVGRLLAAWSAVTLILLALAFMAKELGATSRIWVGLWFVYGLIGLFTVRLLFNQQIQSWRRDGQLTRNVAIVGAGDIGQRLVEQMKALADPGVRVVGVFDDRGASALGVAGTVDDLLERARTGPLDQVIIALPRAEETRLLGALHKLKSLPVDVLICPDLVGLPLQNRQLSEVAGVPMLHVLERPLIGWSFIAKAIEDRVLAALIILLIMPISILIALAIKLEGPGPVLVRERRFGFGDLPIDVYRFRTLTRDGAGITAVGRFLHRHSLDELPQFINVFLGTMSIVGPRPALAPHASGAAAQLHAYALRHGVKPGITGWAQVNGLRGEGATGAQRERRLQHDLYYIENWSLWFDLRIILQTLWVGFRRPAA